LHFLAAFEPDFFCKRDASWLIYKASERLPGFAPRIREGRGRVIAAHPETVFWGWVPTR